MSDDRLAAFRHGFAGRAPFATWTEDTILELLATIDALRAEVEHLQREIAKWEHDKTLTVKTMAGIEADRERLRAEVEEMKGLANDYRSQAHRYHADMMTVRDQRDEARAEAQRANEGSALLLEANTEYHAEVERLREALSEIERADSEAPAWVRVVVKAALSSAPPAKPSAVEPASEADELGDPFAPDVTPAEDET